MITDPDALLRARALGLQSWTADGDRQFVRISSELVSGRRLLPRPNVVFAG